jgi:hypothetical protein
LEHPLHSCIALALVTALGGAVVGCGKAPSSMMQSQDMTPGPSGSVLALNIAIVAPTTVGLVISSGSVEFERLSLYGDVPADMRTMTHVSASLPADQKEVTFPAAPYGLYSRAQVPVDDVHAHGTWKGTPLDIYFEPDSTRIDLSGPTLDYEAGMSEAFLITMTNDAWLTPAILDGAAVGADGTIHVDQLDNPSTVSAMSGALQGAFTLAQAPTQ